MDHLSEWKLIRRASDHERRILISFGVSLLYSSIPFLFVKDNTFFLVSLALILAVSASLHSYWEDAARWATIVTARVSALYLALFVQFEGKFLSQSDFGGIIVTVAVILIILGTASIRPSRILFLATIVSLLVTVILFSKGERPVRLIYVLVEFQAGAIIYVLALYRILLQNDTLTEEGDHLITGFSSLVRSGSPYFPLTFNRMKRSAKRSWRSLFEDESSS